jgi:hypothetical protein
MIKRLKNTPRLAWLVVGGCVAAILVPSAAVATGLVYNGIKGPSGNKADVTTASQLLTAPATPANYFSSADVALSPTYTAVATPAAGDGLVVTSVNISVTATPTPGTSVINFDIGNPSCSGYVGPFQHGVYPSSIGPTEITFNPGLVIPSGDALCAAANVGTYVDAIGYTGSSAAIP